MQRFEITTEEIDRLVRVFYQQIRVHEVLGPIFNRAIGTDPLAWQRHENKISSFWRNVAGIDRAYQGTPMVAHMENSEIQPEHFQIWLTLFHEVAEEVLPPDRAYIMGTYADRIGKGLANGVAIGRRKKGAPPVFV